MLKKFFATAIVSIFLAGCGSSGEEERAKATQAEADKTKAEAAAKYNAKQAALKPIRDSFLAEIKNEKLVKDAAWLHEETNSLLVGVTNEGSRRDGYAESICMDMTNKRLYGGTVRIMDATAAIRDEWKELGRANCNSEENSQTITLIEFGPGGKIASQKEVPTEQPR